MGIQSVSQPFELTKEDLKRWGNNILKFTSTAFLLFLTALSQNVPLKQAVYILYLALINAAIDLLTKYKETNVYMK